MGYYVFVDNSNVWIEGKFASAVRNGQAKSVYDAHENGVCDNSWKIDFGKLLNCVVQGNVADIKEAIIVGSKPTQKDSLWKAMEAAGFKVETHDRNQSNKEKKVDTGIVQKINDKLYEESEPGDEFVLVMGDKDYVPVIETIVRKGRIAHIAFWDNAATELTGVATKYTKLNDYIREIEY